MKEDFFICITLGSHHRRSDLTESDTMTPTFAVKDQGIPGLICSDRFPVSHIFKVKRRAFEMAFRKQSSDFQFLTHSERFL